MGIIDTTRGGPEDFDILLNDNVKNTDRAPKVSGGHLGRGVLAQGQGTERVVIAKQSQTRVRASFLGVLMCIR